MNKITINGVEIIGGRSVVINNGKVIVDGKDVTPESLKVNIVVVGDVETIQCDASSEMKIEGNVTHGIRATSGNIGVDGNVSGSVITTSGDVHCKDVGGSVTTTSGDVSCDGVTGSVTTVSGDIYR